MGIHHGRNVVDFSFLDNLLACIVERFAHQQPTLMRLLRSGTPAYLVAALLLQAAYLRCQDLAPVPAPSGCSVVPIATLNDGQTSSSYRLLAHLLSAMDMGNQTVRRGLEKNRNRSPKTASHEEQISDILLNLDETRDGYLCAAYRIDQFHPASEDEKTAKEGVVIAFAELAEMTDKLKERTKRKFAALETGTSQSQVEGADELASLEHQRDGAYSYLLDATALALLTVKTTSPRSQTVDAVKLSCTEKTNLLLQAAKVAADRNGKFTAYVNLIADDLRRPNKCQ